MPGTMTIIRDTEELNRKGFIFFWNLPSSEWKSIQMHVHSQIVISDLMERNMSQSIDVI